MNKRRHFVKSAASVTAALLAGCAESEIRRLEGAEDEKLQEKKDYDSFTELIEPDDPEVKRLAERTDIGRLGASLSVIFPEEVEFHPRDDVEYFGEDEYRSRPAEYIKNDFHGDCDDYSIFNTSLIQAKGSVQSEEIEARSVLDTREGKEHVLTEVKYEDEYWVTDVRFPGRFYRRDRFIEEVDWQPQRLISDDSIENYESNW